MMSNGGAEALTVADLEDLVVDDDDDEGTEYTDGTDDDSFLENSSLRKMVRNSILMLDTLADEVAGIGGDDDKKQQNNDNKNNNSTNQKPRIVTPSSGIKDMTINVSFDSGNNNNNNNNKPRIVTTRTDTSSNLPMMSSPLTSPISTASVKKVRSKNNNSNDLPRIPDSDDNNEEDNQDVNDDLSLDDSLANEMNALIEVAIELEKELKTQNLHTVQQVIERIGNSKDPKIKAVLESEDKKIIRNILNDEIKKNEPQNTVLRYIYKTIMNTLTQEEEKNILLGAVVLLWAVVTALVLNIMCVDITTL